MTYVEEKNLEQFISIKNITLYANRQAIEAIYHASVSMGGVESVLGHIVAGDIPQFASCISENVEFRDYSQTVRDARMGVFSIFIGVDDDKLYKVEPHRNDCLDFMAYPVEGDDVSMHKWRRTQIEKHINEQPGVHKDKSPMFNMYIIAMMSMFGTGEEKVVEEVNPQDNTRTVIRERVIEREKEPELEGIFRNFMAEAITKVAIDDMVPRIKQKIIDEFGIEPQKHVVKIFNNERQFDGVVHEMFDTVLHYLANKTPVYMYGPTGTGKGELVKQVAKALGTDLYAMNSVTDEFKIAGFIDANGIYHETEFFKAFTNGGLFFLDEMDASAPEVLVCLNMAIADGYFAFPNGRFEAHDDFRIVAAGNTLGTGADAMYTGRLQLDAASLNRFSVVPVGYDRRIDEFVCDGDQELVEFAQQYRKSLKECGLPGACSYRNLSQIKVSQAAMSDEKALCFCLTKEMNRDDINTIIGRGLFDEGNRYFKALKNVESLVG